MIQIFNKITEAGGYPLIVGGYVRDMLLGLSPKDVDVEVYRIDANKLESILSTFGKVDSVGKSFGILKLNFEGKILDFSLPRRESKSGAGHTGFQVEVDPTMTVKEAAARRDFTINSLAVNPLTDEVLDYYGGMDDLHFRVLKHTSPAFSEDPLRVLRGMQFCSRFNLVPTGETLQLCRDLAPTYSELAKERIYEELKKWSLSAYPSKGLEFLRHCGWLSHFHILEDIKWCEQDPTWHPEGHVFTHTQYVCDEAALIAMREGFTKEETSNLLFAALLHDVGKPSTTFTKNGRVVSPGHDVAGEALAASWMESLNFPHQSAQEIKTLVRTHMVHCGGVSARKARRLIHRVKPNFKLLWALIEADHSGRPPLPKNFPQSAASLKELVDAQDVREPLVKGRHLIELGWEAGPLMGKELKRLFELQIEEGLGFDQLINNVKN